MNHSYHSNVRTVNLLTVIVMVVENWN